MWLGDPIVEMLERVHRLAGPTGALLEQWSESWYNCWSSFTPVRPGLTGEATGPYLGLCEMPVIGSVTWDKVQTTDKLLRNVFIVTVS